MELLKDLDRNLEYIKVCVFFEYYNIKLWRIRIGYISEQSVEGYHKTCSMVFRNVYKPERVIKGQTWNTPTNAYNLCNISISLRIKWSTEYWYQMLITIFKNYSIWGMICINFRHIGLNLIVLCMCWTCCTLVHIIMVIWQYFNCSYLNGYCFKCTTFCIVSSYNV